MILGFREILMNDWLSHQSRNSVMWMMLSYEKNYCNQMPSLATKVAAMYSALVEDNATVACFLFLHVMAPPAKVKTNPDVDRDVSLSPSQSAFVHP